MTSAIRIMPRFRAIVVLALCAAPLGAQQKNLPLKHKAERTTVDISVRDLMSRLYVYADDSLQGREAGSMGHMKATAYIAAELKKLGLEPAGVGGTYFQDVPFISRRLSSGATISASNRLFNAYADFIAAPFRGASPRPMDGVQVVYGGVFGDSTQSITASQAAGKLVVIEAPNGIGRITPNSPFAEAAGVALIGGGMLTPQQMALGRTPSLTLPPAPGAPSVPLVLTVTRLMAESMLAAPLDGMKAGTVAAEPLHASILFDENVAPTRNVVAVLRGADPALRGEYVAVGAHSDHVGFRAAGPVDHDSLHLYNAQRYFAIDNPSGKTLTADERAAREARVAAIRVNLDSVHRKRPARRDSINNGADDDGSGTVAVLEIAEALAKGKAKPKRSVLFVWHTGEEKGLLGSRYFTDNPTVPRDSIVAQVNIDMIGRGAATDLPAGSASYLQLVGSRRLSTELGDLVETLNKSEKVPFTLDYTFDADGHPDNIYCRSDHYNYARYGIPVVFLTTGVHGDYHQVTDEPQYIDYPHLTHVTQFALGLVREVANRTQRPVVDKPKPDPTGVCRQ
jgi:hypothetical protein